MGQLPPPRGKLMLSSPEHAPAYMMAANDGVIKAIVCFYRVNSDRAFERHRSRILINDSNTVHALKKHLIQFLGLKELTLIYGLGDFDSHFFPLRECGTAGALGLYSFHIHFFFHCGSAGLREHWFYIHFIFIFF